MSIPPRGRQRRTIFGSPEDIVPSRGRRGGAAPTAGRYRPQELAVVRQCRGWPDGAVLSNMVGICQHSGLDPCASLREAVLGLFALGEWPSDAALSAWLPDAGKNRTATLAAVPKGGG